MSSLGMLGSGPSIRGLISGSIIIARRCSSRGLAADRSENGATNSQADAMIDLAPESRLAGLKDFTALRHCCPPALHTGIATRLHLFRDRFFKPGPRLGHLLTECPFLLQLGRSAPTPPPPQTA